MGKVVKQDYISSKSWVKITTDAPDIILFSKKILEMLLRQLRNAFFHKKLHE